MTWADRSQLLEQRTSGLRGQASGPFYGCDFCRVHPERGCDKHSVVAEAG